MNNKVKSYIINSERDLHVGDVVADRYSSEPAIIQRITHASLTGGTLYLVYWINKNYAEQVNVSRLKFVSSVTDATRSVANKDFRGRTPDAPRPGNVENKLSGRRLEGSNITTGKVGKAETTSGFIRRKYGPTGQLLSLEEQPDYIVRSTPILSIRNQYIGNTSTEVKAQGVSEPWWIGLKRLPPTSQLGLPFTGIPHIDSPGLYREERLSSSQTGFILKRQLSSFRRYDLHSPQYPSKEFIKTDPRQLISSRGVSRPDFSKRYTFGSSIEITPTSTVGYRLGNSTPPPFNPKFIGPPLEGDTNYVSRVNSKISVLPVHDNLLGYHTTGYFPDGVRMVARNEDRFSDSTIIQLRQQKRQDIVEQLSKLYGMDFNDNPIIDRIEKAMHNDYGATINNSLFNYPSNYIGAEVTSEESPLDPMAWLNKGMQDEDYKLRRLRKIRRIFEEFNANSIFNDTSRQKFEEALSETEGLGISSSLKKELLDALKMNTSDILDIHTPSSPIMNPRSSFVSMKMSPILDFIKSQIKTQETNISGLRSEIGSFQESVNLFGWKHQRMLEVTDSLVNYRPGTNFTWKRKGKTYFTNILNTNAHWVDDIVGATMPVTDEIGLKTSSFGPFGDMTKAQALERKTLNSLGTTPTFESDLVRINRYIDSQRWDKITKKYSNPFPELEDIASNVFGKDDELTVLRVNNILKRSKKYSASKISQDQAQLSRLQEWFESPNAIGQQVKFDNILMEFKGITDSGKFRLSPVVIETPERIRLSIPGSNRDDLVKTIVDMFTRHGLALDKRYESVMDNPTPELFNNNMLIFRGKEISIIDNKKENIMKLLGLESIESPITFLNNPLVKTFAEKSSIYNYITNAINTNNQENLFAQASFLHEIFLRTLRSNLNSFDNMKSPTDSLFKESLLSNARSTFIRQGGREAFKRSFNASMPNVKSFNEFKYFDKDGMEIDATNYLESNDNVFENVVNRGMNNQLAIELAEKMGIEEVNKILTSEKIRRQTEGHDERLLKMLENLNPIMENGQMSFDVPYNQGLDLVHTFGVEGFTHNEILGVRGVIAHPINSVRNEFGEIVDSVGAPISISGEEANFENIPGTVQIKRVPSYGETIGKDVNKSGMVASFSRNVVNNTPNILGASITPLGKPQIVTHIESGVKQVIGELGDDIEVDINALKRRARPINPNSIFSSNIYEGGLPIWERSPGAYVAIGTEGGPEYQINTLKDIIKNNKDLIYLDIETHGHNYGMIGQVGAVRKSITGQLKEELIGTTEAWSGQSKNVSSESQLVLSVADMIMANPDSHVVVYNENVDVAKLATAAKRLSNNIQQAINNLQKDLQLVFSGDGGHFSEINELIDFKARLDNASRVLGDANKKVLNLMFFESSLSNTGGFPSLDTVLRRRGLSFSKQQHTALIDARDTSRLLEKMKGDYSSINTSTWRQARTTDFKDKIMFGLSTRFGRDQYGNPIEPGISNRMIEGFQWSTYESEFGTTSYSLQFHSLGGRVKTSMDLGSPLEVLKIVQSIVEPTNEAGITMTREEAEEEERHIAKDLFNRQIHSILHPSEKNPLAFQNIEWKFEYGLMDHNTLLNEIEVLKTKEDGISTERLNWIMHYLVNDPRMSQQFKEHEYWKNTQYTKYDKPFYDRIQAKINSGELSPQEAAWAINKRTQALYGGGLGDTPGIYPYMPTPGKKTFSHSHITPNLAIGEESVNSYKIYLRDVGKTRYGMEEVMLAAFHRTYQENTNAGKKIIMEALGNQSDKASFAASFFENGGKFSEKQVYARETLANYLFETDFKFKKKQKDIGKSVLQSIREAAQIPETSITRTSPRSDIIGDLANFVRNHVLANFEAQKQSNPQLNMDEFSGIHWGIGLEERRKTRPATMLKRITAIDNEILGSNIRSTYNKEVENRIRKDSVENAKELAFTNIPKKWMREGMENLTPSQYAEAHPGVAQSHIMKMLQADLTENFLTPLQHSELHKQLGWRNINSTLEGITERNLGDASKWVYTNRNIVSDLGQLFHGRNLEEVKSIFNSSGNTPTHYYRAADKYYGARNAIASINEAISNAEPKGPSVARSAVKLNNLWAKFSGKASEFGSKAPVSFDEIAGKITGMLKNNHVVLLSLGAAAIIAGSKIGIHKSEEEETHLSGDPQITHSTKSVQHKHSRIVARIKGKINSDVDLGKITNAIHSSLALHTSAEVHRTQTTNDQRTKLSKKDSEKIISKLLR